MANTKNSELTSAPPGSLDPVMPDPPCCEVWPKIAHRFDWMRYSHQTEMLTLPHFQVGDTKWRVNFCPACGKPASLRNVRADELA